MKNKYRELRERQQTEINNFPLGAAFSDKQFVEMMHKWELDPETDTDKIISIGGGCFIRKADKAQFIEICNRHTAEHQAAMDGDTTGDGYIYDMFMYELANHEFCITGDYDETLDACGLEPADITNNAKLKNALKKATASYGKE